MGTVATLPVKAVFNGPQRSYYHAHFQHLFETVAAQPGFRVRVWDGEKTSHLTAILSYHDPAEYDLNRIQKIFRALSNGPSNQMKFVLGHDVRGYVSLTTVQDVVHLDRQNLAGRSSMQHCRDDDSLPAGPNAHMIGVHGDLAAMQAQVMDWVKAMQPLAYNHIVMALRTQEAPQGGKVLPMRAVIKSGS